MSIICTEFKIPSSGNRSVPKFVRATIDPATTNQLPFPSDYKYYSCVLRKKYELWADRLSNFKVRSDDIWVLGFPKSGTTWTQNIVNELKIDQMRFANVWQPSTNLFDAPFYFEKLDDEDEEFTRYVDAMDKSLDLLDALPSPRMIKSHLPAYLLPKEIWTIQPKMIYTSREAKDTAISLFHMVHDDIALFTNTISIFLYLFRKDMIMPGPFYEHISSFKQLNHLEHLLCISYEDLSEKPFETIKCISEFLECSYGDEQLKQLVEYVSFGNMRAKIESFSKNGAFSFCRKGQVGGYRDEMNQDDIKLFDEWTATKKEQLKLH